MLSRRRSHARRRRRASNRPRLSPGLLAFGKLAERVDLIAFVETGAGDVVEDGHLLGASYIAGDGAPPFAGLYGDVGHERFQVLILRT